MTAGTVICLPCWRTAVNMDGDPPRAHAPGDRPLERCAACGRDTNNGIRVDVDMPELARIARVAGEHRWPDRPKCPGCGETWPHHKTDCRMLAPTVRPKIRHRLLYAIGTRLAAWAER